MKILFLPENYFPNVSGVPVVVKYLAEGLLKKGYDVAVACKTFGNEPISDIINGVKVFRFKLTKDFWHRYHGDIKGFINFVLDYKADVNILECSQCVTTDILLPHLSQISGKKIFHSHGFCGLEGKFFSIKDSIKHTLGTTYDWFEARLYFYYTLKKAMPYFDATLCLSEVDSSREYLKKRSKKSYILDNAADDMFFDKEQCHKNTLGKYTKLENDLFFVSCANYWHVKNQKAIIREFYLSKSSKNHSLVCIGSQKNDYYLECKKLIDELDKKYGHRDIHLLYGVNRNDIPAIINKASLYLVASIQEQYSISIIEAMSQGVPFISTNVGNARTLPGGITIQKEEDMHDVIDSLMANPNKRNDFSQAGKQYAFSKCRIGTVVDKLYNIIENL